MEKNQNPILSKADEIAMAQFKRAINSRNAYSVLDEPSYNRTEKVYSVHRRDEKSSVIIDSFHFSTEEVAKIAIDYAKSMRV